MGTEYTKKILIHYFELAGAVDGWDDQAEIESAVDELYSAAIREAKSQIWEELARIFHKSATSFGQTVPF